MAETMKDSGNIWIGKIPQSWSTKRIKYLATLKGRIGWQGLTSDEYQDKGAYLITGVDFLNGGINWDSCVHVPMKRWEEAKEIQIQNEALLITKDGTVGKVAIVSGLPGPTSLNSGVLRIMPKKGYSKRFLYWVLQSDVFWNWFNYKNAGNSTIIHLYQGDFAEFMYAFPDEKEQEVIADFLYRQCCQIDDVITELENQIRIILLYKDTLIKEVVLVNRENWKCGRVKDVVTLQRGRDLPQDDFIEGEYPVYGSNGVIGYHNKFTTKGPCVVVGRSGSVGEINYVIEDFWSHNTSIYVRDAKGNNMRYIYYLLISLDIKDVANGSAVPTLDRKNVEAIHIAFPTECAEQEGIASYLDKRCSAVDNIIEEKQAAIKSLKKYRKSLVYEYVTGKKRVKEVE